MTTTNTRLDRLLGRRKKKKKPSAAPFTAPNPTADAAAATTAGADQVAATAYARGKTKGGVPLTPQQAVEHGQQVMAQPQIAQSVKDRTGIRGRIATAAAARQGRTIRVTPGSNVDGKRNGFAGMKLDYSGYLSPKAKANAAALRGGAPGGGGGGGVGFASMGDGLTGRAKQFYQQIAPPPTPPPPQADPRVVAQAQAELDKTDAVSKADGGTPLQQRSYDRKEAMRKVLRDRARAARSRNQELNTEARRQGYADNNQHQRATAAHELRQIQDDQTFQREQKEQRDALMRLARTNPDAVAALAAFDLPGRQENDYHAHQQRRQAETLERESTRDFLKSITHPQGHGDAGKPRRTRGGTSQHAETLDKLLDAMGKLPPGPVGADGIPTANPLADRLMARVESTLDAIGSDQSGGLPEGVKPFPYDLQGMDPSALEQMPDDAWDAMADGIPVGQPFALPNGFIVRKQPGSRGDLGIIGHVDSWPPHPQP